ncbi:hypothetical protein AB0M32_12455 [Streptomyces sp. NPDC051985]|uniref:hypothetical protein n=1 Tax=Streptomyces sp. NPDC051985 TaxID=3155807 RepID=UPI0034445842
MATIRNRIRRDGTASFQVRWLQGGRGGSWESERFGELTAQQWPYGWVPGQGFVEPEQDPDDVPLVEWSRHYVERLTGIDKRTRDDYLCEVDRHVSLFVHTTRAGLVMPATIGNITADDAQDWIRRPAAPKSIANRHGLLWCVVQAAIEPLLIGATRFYEDAMRSRVR